MTGQSAVAREIAAIRKATFCSKRHDVEVHAIPELRDNVAKALTRARQEGAEEMRERAAKAIERPAGPDWRPGGSWNELSREQAADSIRALPISTQSGA